MKMNKKELFALMGKLDDRYIAASAYIAEGGEDIVYERPARRRAAAFFQSGWFVAVLCAVVSLSVVGAMVWAGRQEPIVVPPEGTTAEESEVSSEQIRVEDETEVTVKTRKKVTVTVKDCLGRPYEIVYYLTYVPTYGLCISPVVPMVPAPTVSITLQTQAEGHLICNPEVMMGADLTHTFTSEEEAIAYADQLVGAIVHVGYDNEHLFCTACNTDVGERTHVVGNEVTFVTRNCAGKICSITYSIKEDPDVSSRWIVENISAKGYIEWKDEDIEHIYSDFATREDAINFGSQLKNELVAHTEYGYIPRIAPTCTEAGATEGADCASCGKILIVPTPVAPTRDHRITWSKCETCDLTASEGLIYIPYGQSSCYVAGFAEDAPDKTKAVIPTYAPDGRPVIGVADGAFEGCDTLSYVLLPKIISYVGTRSFADCPALKEVYFSGREGQWRVNVNKANDWCDENVTVSFYGDRITS